MSVTKVISQHPSFLYSFKNKDYLKPYLKNSNGLYLRRQDISSLYYLEGSIYFSKISTLLKEKTFNHNKTCGFKLEKWKSLEIDDIDDFNLAKFYVKNLNIFKTKKMNKGQKLLRKAKKIILEVINYYRRSEMFLPGLWPAYYKKAKGCKVWI